MKIAIVDIETTGFLEQGGKIVEIGIVGLDLYTGKTVDEFNSIVKQDGFGINHTKGQYGWIFKNSNLTFEEVDSAESLKTFLPEIQSILDKYKIGATAYNKQFDFGFLRSQGLRIKDVACIMLSVTPVVNLPPAFGHNSPKWPKVNEAWDYFFPDTPYTEIHRAIDDARHEAKIAYKLFKRGNLRIFGETT